MLHHAGCALGTYRQFKLVGVALYFIIKISRDLNLVGQRETRLIAFHQFLSIQTIFENEEQLLNIARYRAYKLEAKSIMSTS